MGAIDGTHISAIVGASDQASFRDRWGKLSQSVMAACSFDLRFLHVLSGWEGSAADGCVLGAAREKDFKVPEGISHLQFDSFFFFLKFLLFIKCLIFFF